MADGDSEVLGWEDSDEGGGLGRYLWHDPQNRQFAARGTLFPDRKTLPPSRPRPWWTIEVFDQNHLGDRSYCTAEGASGVRRTSPYRHIMPKVQTLTAYDTEQERYDLYLAAKLVDPWPGEHYAGTSTDAPFRVLRDRGHIREWRWCFGIDDVLACLRAYGPVSIGTNWHEGMDTPDRFGRVKISGQVRGGHAYRLVHDDEDSGEVVAVNSWGRGWGRSGRFKLAYAQLDELLSAQGEAVTVVP